MAQAVKDMEKISKEVKQTQETVQSPGIVNIAVDTRAQSKQSSKTDAYKYEVFEEEASEIRIQDPALEEKAKDMEIKEY